MGVPVQAAAVKAEPGAVKAEKSNGVLPPGTVGPKAEHAADLTRGKDEQYLARILDPGSAGPSTHTNIAPPPESAPAGAAAGIATQDPGCAAALYFRAVGYTPEECECMLLRFAGLHALVLSHRPVPPDNAGISRIGRSPSPLPQPPAGTTPPKVLP